MDGKGIIILVAVVLLIGGLVAFYFYKKRHLEQFFSQIHEEAKSSKTKEKCFSSANV